MSPLLLKALPIGGGLALLYLLTKKPAAPAPNVLPEPQPAPPAPVPDVPVIPPPGPNPFPDSASTATVMAPNGLWLHTTPDTATASRMKLLPFNSYVMILDGGAVATGSGLEWFHVQTPDRQTGWVSTEWVLFGTDKERGMTPEEERAYHEHMAEKEDPIFQGRAGSATIGALSWHGVRPAKRPFVMAPMRVLAVARLRTAPNLLNAVATVPAGEVVQCIRAANGWVLCRYRDRHAPRAPVSVGWLPQAVLGAA